MQRICRSLAMGSGLTLSTMAMAQPCVPPSSVWVSASDRCGSVELSIWASSQSNLTSYRLVRRIGIDSTPQIVADFGRSAPRTWADTTAPAGAAIYYQLEAWVDTCVTRSDWSHIQRLAVTQPPLNFWASDLTHCGQVALGWRNQFPCGNNTTVYRAEYPEFSAAMPIQVISTRDGYIDPDVEADTPYFYWATNRSPLGESAPAGPLLGRASSTAAPIYLGAGRTLRLPPFDVYRYVLPARAGYGDSLQYQWFKDGEALSDSDHIEGSQTNELTLVGSSSSDSGSYRLQATNQCATSMSEPIQLEVKLDYCFGGGCRIDTCTDGAIDGRDIQSFLEVWSSGEPCGDWNMDGGIDFSDLSEFMYAWENWCC